MKTHEIDGVVYQEAKELKKDSCKGCDLLNKAQCVDAKEVVRCLDKNLILKALEGTVIREGLRYKRVPEKNKNTCAGCAFIGKSTLCRGLKCEDTNTIFIPEEAVKAKQTITHEGVEYEVVPEKAASSCMSCDLARKCRGIEGLKCGEESLIYKRVGEPSKIAELEKEIEYLKEKLKKIYELTK